MKKCPMFSGTEECMYKDIGKWCADCPQLKGFLRRIYQSLTGGEEPDECGHRLFTQFLPPAFMKRHQDELTLVEEEARDEYERGRGDAVRDIKQEIEEILSRNEISKMLKDALTKAALDENGVKIAGLFDPNATLVMELEEILRNRLNQVLSP